MGLRRRRARAAPGTGRASWPAGSARRLAERVADGTRASVLDALFATRLPESLLGAVSFDRNGDIATSPVTILRVAGTDAVTDRVLQVPAGLIR